MFTGADLPLACSYFLQGVAKGLITVSQLELCVLGCLLPGEGNHRLHKITK